jgi:hypothetical protein
MYFFSCQDLRMDTHGSFVLVIRHVGIHILAMMYSGGVREITEVLYGSSDDEIDALGSCYYYNWLSQRSSKIGG